MKKSAGIPWGVVAKAVAGAGIGGAMGYEVTPRVFGYEDTPSARRAAAFINAILGGTIGGIGPKALWTTMHSPIVTAFEHAKNKNIPVNVPWKALKTFVAPPLAIVAGETVPIGQAALTQARQAAEANAEAARTSSIPQGVRDLLQSGTTRGAGVGAAGAGMAALLSGLARRRSERELVNQTPRSNMVGKDFLKYLLPAMAAGGVMGSLSTGGNGQAATSSTRA